MLDRIGYLPIHLHHVTFQQRPNQILFIAEMQIKRAAAIVGPLRDLRDGDGIVALFQNQLEARSEKIGVGTLFELLEANIRHLSMNGQVYATCTYFYHGS